MIIIHCIYLYCFVMYSQCKYNVVLTHVKSDSLLDALFPSLSEDQSAATETRANEQEN